MGWAFMLFPFLLSLFAPSIRKPSYSRFASRWDAAWRPQRFGRDPSRVPRGDPYPHDALQKWLERKQQQQTQPSFPNTFRDDYYDKGPNFSDLSIPGKCGKEPLLNDRKPSALSWYKPSPQRYEKFTSGQSSPLLWVTDVPNHRLALGSNRPGSYGLPVVDPYRKTYQTLADVGRTRLVAILLQRLLSQHQGQVGNGANSAGQAGRLPWYDRQAGDGNKQSPLAIPARDLSPLESSSSTLRRPDKTAWKDKVKWGRQASSKTILSKMAPSRGRPQQGFRGTSGYSLNSGAFGGTSGNSLKPGPSGGSSGNNSLYSGPFGGTSGNTSLKPGPAGHSHPGTPESNAIYPLAFRPTREGEGRKMH